jgi:hypothetical protein
MVGQKQSLRIEEEEIAKAILERGGAVVRDSCPQNLSQMFTYIPLHVAMPHLAKAPFQRGLVRSTRVLLSSSLCFFINAPAHTADSTEFLE